MPKTGALIAGLCFTAAVAMSAPLDVAGRKVLLVVGDALTTASAKVTLPSSGVARSATFSVPMNREEKEQCYGLRVPSHVAALVRINGRPLDVEPLHRPDGDLYRIPEFYWREGENVLEIEPKSVVPKGATWDGTMLFSLDGSFEEIHFAQAFAENVPKAPPPADPLQSKIDVLHYDCAWVPSMTASSLTSASVTVTARSLQANLTQCVLDFDSNGGALAIATVDQGPGTPSLAYTIDTTNNKLRITLPSPVGLGEEFKVRINYAGTPRPTGPFGPPYVRSTHGTPAVAVVYTFSEPYGARQWWPCKDLPDDKATSSVQRIVVPKGQGWQVVSNGRLEQIVDHGATETWVWVNHYPISTYLVSFCVSNYVYSTSVYTSRDASTTMSIAHAIYPENFSIEGNGAAGTLQVMNFFADRFGEYPFLDEKYFTASHNSGSGMEHQTCTSMPGGDVQDGMQRRNVHELAHQWFGDKITPLTFEHLWLNEGFATYCEALWDEYKFGPYAFWARVNGWTVSTSQTVAGPDSDNFSLAAVYRKGAWVLHMLRHVVGDGKFWETMRMWAQHPAVSYANAISDDFESVAESVAGMDLSAFFAQWLWRSDTVNPPAQPTYRFRTTTARSGMDWHATFFTTQAISGTPYAMPLDYEIVCQDNTTTLVRVWNSALNATDSVNLGTSVPLEVDLDPDNWVLKTMALSINTCSLGRLAVGQPFQYRLQAGYGASPYTWSGSGLPPGLTLSSSGLVSGTPTTSGIYNATVTVTDANANSLSTTLLADVIPDPLLPEMIVESRTSSGAKTSAPVYQETGTFSNTTSKSSAPGTVGSGARFSTQVGAKASFNPPIPLDGYYDVYVTLDDRYTGPNNDAHASFVVQNDGPDVTGTVYLHPYTPGLRNKWLKLASHVPFRAGSAGTVGGITLTNLDGDGTGANPQNRFCVDAVKFVYVAPLPTRVESWDKF
ncbi:MAG: M1 family aminopeptidase [Candidatus Sumerlaeaceae bacterium]